jgi:Uncharacterised ArCR, COG2043
VAFGRPACAALAVAANEGKPTLSFGCSGMRTFTGVGEDKLLVSLPGSQLGALFERLQAINRANDQMLAFYRQHQSQFLKNMVQVSVTGLVSASESELRKESEPAKLGGEQRANSSLISLFTNKRSA